MSSRGNSRRGASVPPPAPAPLTAEDARSAVASIAALAERMSPTRGSGPGVSRRGASTPPPALAPLTPEDAAASIAALAARMGALADEGRALEAELDKATSPMAGDRAAARDMLAIAPCEIGRAVIETLDARLGTCATWLNAFDEQLGHLDASLRSLDAACAVASLRSLDAACASALGGGTPRSEPPTAALARAASRLDVAAAAVVAPPLPPPHPEWLSAAAGFVAGLAAVGALLFLTGRREAQAPSSAQYQSAAAYRHAVLWCTRSLARRSDLAYR